MALTLGARFKSFKDVESALAKFEETTFTKLWKRDSRTIAASRITRKINENLIYYEIRTTVQCIHDSVNNRKINNIMEMRFIRFPYSSHIFSVPIDSTTTLELPIVGSKLLIINQKSIPLLLLESHFFSTYRNGCPIFIQFRASSDGLTLEIKPMEGHHNHETSKELYAHYASERQLPPDIRNEAKNVFAMKANKKIVQQKLQQKTGKIITLRDLTNIQATLNDGKADSLENCINILRTEYSANVCVLQDDKQNFQGLFAQTEAMKKMAAAYPEFLAIDATYKLLKISVPLYLIITEDGACQTEIVAMCLLTNEDQKSLSWFLSTFKEQNPECENTKCIITDKDMSERQVKQIFLNASLIICIFHSLKTFRREVTCEKLGITQSQRNQCLELFQKLLYASTDREFQEIEASLNVVAPKAVRDYYNKNWRDIRNEWNMNENFVKYNFLNNTNNRLECLNSKLKSVISKNSSLEDFIHGFFTIVSALQQERHHKAIYSIQKRICSKYSSESEQYKYFKYSTREAAKHVIKEIELSTMQVHEENDPNKNDRHFIVRQGKNMLRVTEDHCSCAFFISMILPCRHIFAVRKLTNQPIFYENLVEKRWTLGYFKAQHRVFTEQNNNNIENDNILITTQPSSKTLSYAQKTKKALGRTDILADLCAQRSNMLYEQRSQILDNLISYWKAGQQVCIQLIDDFTASDNELERVVDLECDTISINDNTLEGAVCIAYQSSNDKLNNNWMNNDTELHLPETVTSVTQREARLISDKVNNNPTKSDQEFQTTATGCRTSGTTTTTIISDNVAISTIKMPGKVKQRGRPKGQNITVVGLPKKKNKPLPYCNIPIIEKQKFLIKHFISEMAIITAATQDGHLIEEKFVEIRPEKISHAILDKEVDTHIIREFFTHDAWKAVQQVVRVVKKKRIWICSNCQHNIVKVDPSIVCDGCLLWQHLKCANLKTQPKAKFWFCKSCYSR